MDAVQASIAPIVCNAEVVALLSRSGLPVSDLRGQPQIHLFGARIDGSLVGIVAVEACGTVGLLRSLAVSPALRKQGCGLALVRRAEQWAIQYGIGTLYLLTTTAADFFAQLGYQAIARAEAPMEIARTTQFSGLCPSSSSFMRKKLAAGIAQPEVGGTG